MQQIGNSIKSELKSEIQSGQDKLKDMIMTFMLKQTAAPASTSAAPAVSEDPAAPAPQLQLPRSGLNPLVSSFPVQTLLASSLPVPSIVTILAPVSSAIFSKNAFKPTKGDREAGKGIYLFAENFYKVTKGKPDQQINNALMSLCSGEDKLGKFCCAYSASGPTANLNGMPEQWSEQELLCNLRRQFLKPTSHILMVRDALVAEEIDADIFRRVPVVWVDAI
jgi:hypothetical protein